MKLTAENVSKVFFGCMYDEKLVASGDVPTGAIVVEGIRSTIVFDPAKVKLNKVDIKDLLTQISDDFSSKEAGGASFLNLPTRKDGELWGEQMNAEQLMLLGMASGYMRYLIPTDGWPSLPGGMPYLIVSLDGDSDVV